MANQELFRQIDGVLTEFPMLHCQQYWQEADTHATGSCGTTRCVAGWAVWFKAVELGLVSRKRDHVDLKMVRAVARSVNVDTTDEYGSELGMHSLYTAVGGELLGLDSDDAGYLFMDMNGGRVARRVQSYALTGSDISDEEYIELGT